MTDLDIAKKLIGTANSAENRNIEFNLSFKRMKQLMERKTCYYTGVTFVDQHNHKHQRSIDRVDSCKGYVDSLKIRFLTSDKYSL